MGRRMTSKTVVDHAATTPPQPARAVEAVVSGAEKQQSTMGSNKIDLGAIDNLQILNERGEVSDPSLDPNLPDADLLKLHRYMWLTRKLDMRMLNMQRQGEMGTFAPGFGQEATQLAQVYPLSKNDWFCPSYRSFGAQVWRGWPMEQLLLLWDGFFEGFSPPEGVNDLPFSIVIGSHVPTATGIAMGMKCRGEQSVVVTNFGDGASSQGVVAESFNFAAVYKAPVVFVIENNGWAISLPAEKQAAVLELARRGPAFGIPSIRVDGNDMLAMAAATTHAVEHARHGNGPYLIEAVTYRMGMHTTADDPKVYREDADVDAWKSKCPIARFEAYLKNRGLLTDADAQRIADECEQEVLQAREKFREMAKANPREIFDFMYESLPPELEAQRQEYLAKLDRRGIE